MKTPEDYIEKWLADHEEEQNTEALKSAWAMFRSPDTEEDLRAKLLTAIDYMIEKL